MGIFLVLCPFSIVEILNQWNLQHSRVFLQNCAGWNSSFELETEIEKLHSPKKRNGYFKNVQCSSKK
eukprot:c6140_g1_i1 orf=2-199(-)